MGGHGATPPPPTPPRATGTAAPHPPQGGGDRPPPPPPPGRTAASGRGAAAGPASTPPAACSSAGTAMGKQTRASTQGRQRTAPGDSKRARTGAVWGPRPPMPERRQRHPLCCLPREGRGTDRGKGTPRPTGPPVRTVGGNGAQAAPPPTPPPGAGTHQTRRPTPRGAQSPKPGGGKMGLGRPSPKQATRSTGPRQDKQRGMDRGERPYERTAPGLCEVRAPNHPGEGGGADAARALAQTHIQRARGE